MSKWFNKKYIVFYSIVIVVFFCVLFSIMSLSRDSSYNKENTKVQEDTKVQENTKVQEDTKIQDAAIEKLKKEWYKKDKEYIREDEGYTVTTGYLDNGMISFELNDITISLINTCDDKVISNSLLYRDEQYSGVYEYIYNYVEDSLVIKDTVNDDDNDYSGIYKIKK